MLVNSKKKIVFMNGGKHFWNREKDIIAKLKIEFEIILVINHSRDKNYSLSDIEDFCNANQIQLKVIDYTNRKARNIFKIFGDLRNVLEVRNFNPNLTYIESFGSPYFAIFSAILFKSKKTIIAILDYKLHRYTEKSYKFSERFYRFIYLHFFNTYQLFSLDQANMMKNDFPRKRMYTIPLNIIGRDHSLPTIKKENSSVVNFLFFGKIHYYKGLDILIKAANILSKKTTSFKITIAGKCDDFSPYKQLIEDSRFFDLKLYYLDKTELPELFSAANFFVAPYREVTQSGPLMLAFNYKLLPIVSDLPGFNEHVTDNTGFIFKKNSPAELAIVMERAMRLPKIEIEKMNESLEQYIEKEYDLDHLSGKYSRMFNEIISI